MIHELFCYSVSLLSHPSVLRQSAGQHGAGLRTTRQSWPKRLEIWSRRTIDGTFHVGLRSAAPPTITGSSLVVRRGHRWHAAYEARSSLHFLCHKAILINLPLTFRSSEVYYFGSTCQLPRLTEDSKFWTQMAEYKPNNIPSTSTSSNKWLSNQTTLNPHQCLLFSSCIQVLHAGICGAET